LRQFFGMQYVEYAQQVVSGVPFVNWRPLRSVRWTVYCVIFTTN
jgi:hypothetical protein